MNKFSASGAFETPTLLCKAKLCKGPNEEYPYNVQIWFKGTHPGDGWFYCGVGHFCKSMDEVRAYIKERNLNDVTMEDEQ